MTFGVLLVCTGNICRSPVAERIMRARIDPTLPVAVSSAGTMALVGRSIDESSAFALREIGVDPKGHVAKQLSQRDIAAADLVLTAESAHRAAVVQAEPMMFRQTFTLREFARLASWLPRPEPGWVTEEVLRERVAAVASQRGWADPPGPDGDEIVDPLGAPLRVARQCVQELALAVDGVKAALGLIGNTAYGTATVGC